MSALWLHSICAGALGQVGAAESSEDVADAAADFTTPLGILNEYAHIFMVAFLITLLITPLVRRIAIRSGVIDHPNEARKVHREPIAYLGGVAVFFGLFVAIIVGYLTVGDGAATSLRTLAAVLAGMFCITLTGLGDDVWGWDPRAKVAGQLVAAAALATQDVGVRVAEGLLQSVFGLGAPDAALIELGAFVIENGDLYYWTGTAIIAIFVLGGCNSANLIDGLDGLLSGVIAIATVGLLAISLLMVTFPTIPTSPESVVDPLTNAEMVNSLAGPRIILCLAVLGAVLGFLPHNFNPASIFLGDAGSLLLGYMSVVIILTLGENGKTHLVIAGLIVYSIPIMDTTLAIVRRKLSGQSMSTADDQHIHHQMKRATGGVKRAVLSLYGIGILFGLTGVAVAALQLRDVLRVRVIYAVAIVLFGFIGVMAVKAARRAQLQRQMQQATAGRARSDDS